MNERRAAILGWLRVRGGATVDELAAHFGISPRTAHRDIAALREAGAPIEGDPGRGGGVRLQTTGGIPPVQLAIDEVIGLVVAVSLAQRAAPFGRAADQALGRLLAALPAARAAALRRALDRVLVGPPASAAVAASLGPVDDAVLRAFEAAFTAGRALAFRYRDRHGAESDRAAEPHGLLAQVPAWYLLGWDLTKASPRMFRLDRMGAPRLLDLPFQPRPLAVFAPLLEHVPADRIDAG